MNCAQARRMLTLDGESRVLDRHLADCADCGRLAAELDDDRKSLRALRGEMPGQPALLDVRARILEGIRKPEARGGLLLRFERAVRTGHRPRYAAAGLALALATGVLFAITGIDTPPAPTYVVFAPPAPPDLPPPRERPEPATSAPADASPEPSGEVRFVEAFELFEPPRLEVMDLSLINAEDTRPDRVLVKFALEDPNIVILWLADDEDASGPQGGV